MASKTDEYQFVSSNGRQHLIDELHQMGELKKPLVEVAAAASTTTAASTSGKISNSNGANTHMATVTASAAAADIGSSSSSTSLPPKKVADAIATPAITSSHTSASSETSTTNIASARAPTTSSAADDAIKMVDTAKTSKTEDDECSNRSVSSPAGSSTFGTGCLSCGDDDDHANLLLCEGCNAEYHTYCLDPPLRSVPTGDWYCPKCVQDSMAWTEDDDGLERLVCALSPTFTERFGEVCWAYGGAGFGWWPSIIYDPRSVVGGARELARKNIGKRHLVYFFECFDAPWTVLTSTKITSWEKGLQDDLHLGKAARSAGKIRHDMFIRALQAATLENAKPIELRMDWNHTEQPQVLPTPKKRQKKMNIVEKTKKKRARIDMDGNDNATASDGSSIDNRSSSKKGVKGQKKKSKKKRKEHKTRGFPLFGLDGPQFPSHENRSIGIHVDGELFIKLLHKPTLPSEQLPPTSTVCSDNVSTDDHQTSSGGTHNTEHPRNTITADTIASDSATVDTTTKTTPNATRASSAVAKNIGFIKLPSRKTSTFADARTVIEQELVPDVFPAASSTAPSSWRFFIPGLGPMTLSQEKVIGPMLSFLRQTTSDINLGNGLASSPLKVFLVDIQTVVSS